MRTRFPALALCLGLNTTLPAPAQADRQAHPHPAHEDMAIPAGALEALADAVEGYVEDGSVVGGELLVVHDRRTVLHRAFGWRDREDSVRMEIGTIFNIRSMTKPLVGIAAQVLIDEGRLALDDRVATILPAFDNTRARAITVEQLLTHRAGLPMSVVTRLDEYPDLQAIASAAGVQGPQWEPGEEFHYSDAGADALGAVIEGVSGTSLEDFINERVLGPLSMTETFAQLEASDPRWSRVGSLYVRGPDGLVRIWRPEGASMYPFLWGSQGLYSTVTDYARVLAMWLDGGKAGDRRILSTEAVSRMLAPRSSMAPGGFVTAFPGLDVYYGQMAQLWTDADGRIRVIGHGGSDGTIAWAWPELDLMVLYFTQTRGNTTWYRLQRVIERKLLHPVLYTDTPADPERFRPFLGTYVGTFGPFRDDEFRVLVQDGLLALNVPGLFTSPLEEPDSTGRWTLSYSNNVSISFERNQTDSVVAMTWHDGGSAFRLARGAVPAEVALTEADVAPLLGWYRDLEAGTEVEIVFEDGRLAARVPGVPFLQTFHPPDADGFWALQANAMVRVHFERDEAGRVTAYTVHTPDGSTFKRPRISGKEGR